MVGPTPAVAATYRSGAAGWCLRGLVWIDPRATRSETAHGAARDHVGNDSPRQDARHASWRATVRRHSRPPSLLRRAAPPVGRRRLDAANAVRDRCGARTTRRDAPSSLEPRQANHAELPAIQNAPNLLEDRHLTVDGLVDSAKRMVARVTPAAPVGLFESCAHQRKIVVGHQMNHCCVPHPIASFAFFLHGQRRSSNPALLPRARAPVIAHAALRARIASITTGSRTTPAEPASRRTRASHSGPTS